MVLMATLVAIALRILDIDRSLLEIDGRPN